MFDKIKNYLSEKKDVRKKSELYDFEEKDEKESKRLKKISFLDRIKFIKFNKNNEKSKDVSVQRIKEIGLLVTAVVLVGIGYSNFSNNSGVISNNVIATSSTNTLGDVQLVSSSSAVVENNNTVQETVSNSVQSGIVSNDNNEVTNEVIENSVETSSSDNSNYFSKLKMERNDMYSKSIETYQNIIDSQAISSEQKAIAIQEIEKINNLQNSIKVAEELIRLKGFEDVVIYSSNDKISVIVRVATLSNTQVAQIQNIVSKELSVEVSDITISNK